MELIEKMEDLLKQAQTERSHYYVASVLRDAIHEIWTLRLEIARQRLEKEQS